ncbi:hypothetical protein GCK72_016170 [Caenorhabditis remanei]|uniref:Uncharacterized protein n=1 Tax=Caenorhabditis remanei TaxID=31234 RepID=A0A6A5GZ76_CAERE|nr:hypothetical protein GCK72_016170 [Caenorhabditis remanei]KAF1759703.1 hypothetical protein GCK72_016170 [Caenorhabditis remanei]
MLTPVFWIIHIRFYMLRDSEGNELLVDQEIPSAETPKSDTEIKKFGYGFGWTKIGIIERLRGEIGNLVDIQNPEDVEIQIGILMKVCGEKF